MRVGVFASGPERPWGGGFLPDGRLIVSERPGRVRLIAPDGRVSAPLAGVPEVEAGGQGGLLDLRPAPDFATSRKLFFAAATLVEGGALTRLWRARLAAEFGPRGGDELNLIEPGRNHGWPSVTFGRASWGGSIAGAPARRASPSRLPPP